MNGKRSVCLAAMACLFALTCLGQFRSAGELLGRSSGGVFMGELPLRSTSIQLEAMPGVYWAEVTQTFENTSTEVLEVVYVFPLPEEASITDMVLQVGERRIVSVLKEREEAKKTYEEAKAAGQRTALLEQERPNVFTTSIANVMPGDLVSVRFSFQHPMMLEEGRYGIQFPLVVGPRFVPSTIVGWTEEGPAKAPAVEDAARISPPLLGPGVDSGHRVDFELEVLGIPVADVHSSTHVFDWETAGQGLVRVKPQQGMLRADRDLVVELELAGSDKTESPVLISQDGDEAFALLSLYPPVETALADAPVEPRDIVFLIDTSGSMSGESMGQAKAGLLACLKQLRSEDNFNIVRFSDDHSSFSPGLRPAAEDRISAARAYVDNLEADGGTMMQPALKHCLDLPKRDDALPVIIFLTDGDVGNEGQLIHLLHSSIGRHRLFTFGIGSAPNAYLIEEMAEQGRGQAFFIHSHEDIAVMLDRLFRTLDRPVMTQVQMTWLRDGREVEALVYPNPAPDLFLGRPVQVTAKFGRSVPNLVRIQGVQAGEVVEFEQKLEQVENSMLIKQVFGARRIADLTTQWMIAVGDSTMGRLTGNPNRARDQLRQDIIEASLEYGVLSQFTARVAVEEKITRTDEDGEVVTVRQPTETPYGWTMGATATNDPWRLLLGFLALLGAGLAAWRLRGALAG